MTKFWANSRTDPNRRYSLSELIDTEILVDESQQMVQIICDIDKTYIETKFENAVSMIKIAFEQAGEKVTVTGAPIALMAGRWGDIHPSTPVIPGTPRPLHFLSASPPQLRKVIREKLALDGLDWTSDTFKNQVYNLKMGRLKLLKQHVAYKTATILSHMIKAPPGSRFVLIGDNAELDAFIYAGVQLFLDGTLDRPAYQDYLTSGGVDREVLETLDPYLGGSFEGIRVSGILIRRAPGYSFIDARPLTDLVIPFDHYFEVALHFLAWGLITDSALWPICRQFHNNYGFQREELVACLKAAIQSFRQEGRSVEALQDALSRLGRRIPFIDWPERKNLFPGRRLEHLDIDASKILESAYAWVQSIARRDSK